MGGPVVADAAVIPSSVIGPLLLSTGSREEEEEEEEEESSPNNLDPAASVVVVVRVKGPLLGTGILREYEEEDLANLVAVTAVFVFVVVVVLSKGPLLYIGTRREELVDFFAAAVVKFVGFLILSSELL